MIIDFHTHVFPEKISARTVALLEAGSGNRAHSRGTAAGLVTALDEAGADVAVNLPVLTSPTQFESVFRFATELNARFATEGRILSFAGMHPLCEDIEDKMKRIREAGIKGVKIHPDYQGTPITDEGYAKILECAREYDLIVVTHAGVDGAFRDQPVRCTPALALEAIRRTPGVKLVLAHLGANEMSGEFIDTLAGEDVYIDTSFVLSRTPREVFAEILSRHGEDKILFGSDSPWSSIASDVEIIKSFSPRKETEEKILSKNARALLGI